MLSRRKTLQGYYFLGKYAVLERSSRLIENIQSEEKIKKQMVKSLNESVLVATSPEKNRPSLLPLHSQSTPPGASPDKASG